MQQGLKYNMPSRGRGIRAGASSSTTSRISAPPPIPHTSAIEENVIRSHTTLNGASRIPIQPPIPRTSSVEENVIRSQTTLNESGNTTVGSEASSVPSSMMEKDDRQVLIVVGTCIYPSNQAAQKMRLAFLSHLSLGATTWRTVPQHIKHIYWEEFQKMCKWDPNLDQQIYELFMRKGTSRYRALIHELKMLWIARKPKLSGIPDLVWNTLVAHWSDPRVQKKANQNSKNRRSEPLGRDTGMSIHRGGSRAAVDHAIAISKMTGAPASRWSVFCKMHPEGEDGSYTYGVTKKIGDEVQKKAKVMLDDGVQDVDMDKIFMDTTIQKKGRVLGIGNMGQKPPLHTSSFSYADLATRDEMEQRFNEINKREAQINEKINVLDAKIHEVDELRAQFKEMMDMLGRGQIPSFDPTS